MLIGFLGRKRHGKSVSGTHLVRKHGYHEMAFADPLKRGLKEWFGFSDEQLYGSDKEVIDEYWKITPREAMQKFGTEIGRHYIRKIIPHVGENFWIKNMELRYLRSKCKSIVVTDVRYQNEVDFIHKYNGIVIKIIRKMDDIVDEHLSEKAMCKIQNYDYVLDNDGTLMDLYGKLDRIINSNV